MIGMMVACCPGVEYWSWFYRQIDREKIAALKANQGDFDKHMTLYSKAKAHQVMLWWVENARLFKRQLDHGKIGHVTDASTKG